VIFVPECSTHDRAAPSFGIGPVVVSLVCSAGGLTWHHEPPVPVDRRGYRVRSHGIPKCSRDARVRGFTTSGRWARRVAHLWPHSEPGPSERSGCDTRHRCESIERRTSPRSVMHSHRSTARPFSTRKECCVSSMCGVPSSAGRRDRRGIRRNAPHVRPPLQPDDPFAT